MNDHIRYVERYVHGLPQGTVISPHLFHSYYLRSKLKKNLYTNNSISLVSEH